MITFDEYPPLIDTVALGSPYYPQPFQASTDIPGGFTELFVEWWFEDDPETVTTVGQYEFGTDSFLKNMVYRSKVNEYDSGFFLQGTYYSDDPAFLGEANKLVLASQEFCENTCNKQCFGPYGCWCDGCIGNCYPYGGSEEPDVNPYIPSDYEDLSSHQGVQYTSQYRFEGYPGTTIQTKRLNIKNIIKSVKNEVLRNTRNIASNPHLNPNVDDETELLALFAEYGLDPTKMEDQEMFQKLQRFEAENAASVLMTGMILKMLEPIDSILCCLQQNVNSEKDAIFAIAGENLLKHQLVGLIKNESGQTVAVKATANPTHDYGHDILGPIRAVGMVTTAVSKDECCVIRTRGLIRSYDLYMPSGFSDVGVVYYLNSGGTMRAQYYPNTDYCIMQEVGESANKYDFLLRIQTPVIRHGGE